ncbi:hexosaminidase [Haloactinopolyspora alba]|uniref:beta-N-acetylhexosaminidase n=1 Tax=Haloactinopolyspora alba TaxID=648780 RepID=A0A2P8DGN8_9ACTN|nr:beta-N-acetylhexosaminidase [Haloactinopolyspora alba]PSK96397.1 hexosaminidase [Haloactinopolyspora alba]
MTTPNPPVVPLPAEIESGGAPFVLDGSTAVGPDPDAESVRVAEQLAAHVRAATGLPVPVRPGDTGAAITVGRADGSGLGAEGYTVVSDAAGVAVRADAPAGLFYGTQTVRQLFDPHERAVAAARVRDVPRFAWRGAMLDVARHFFGAADIERFIDLVSFYKINVVHLHLSDDQGWRLEVFRRPELTRVGASTQVGGGAGGYLSQEAYREIVAYAAQRFVTIVPEIDMPGHTQAAIAAYPELSATRAEATPYTGTDVGFSSLRAGSAATTAFVEDVVAELAALTPGDYLHIGGDEALSTTEDDYAAFMRAALPVVAGHGKRVVGWQEIARADLGPEALVQYWDHRVPQHAARAASAGAGLVVSPATNVYLDMKYHPDFPLGQDWAGCVELRDAYDWDPATVVDGVDETSVVGVEAPLWTETIVTMPDVETMLLPRMPAVAEVGWTPAARRGWDDFRGRIRAHGRTWQAMGATFHRSPQVDWDT